MSTPNPNDRLGATAERPHDPLIDQLAGRLNLEEGIKLTPYRDTKGKLSIGCGRNLDDVGISPEESDYLLRNDIKRTLADLDLKASWWRQLTPNRQLVIADMAFNMGVGRALPPEGLLGFHDMIGSILKEDWIGAAREMLDSSWAKEVHQRSADLSSLMLRG